MLPEFIPVDLDRDAYYYFIINSYRYPGLAETKIRLSKHIGIPFIFIINWNIMYPPNFFNGFTHGSGSNLFLEAKSSLDPFH
jgi:hypothetical protein